MAWTGLVLTVEGRNALNQAQLSNRINFKSIVVGDGAAPINFRTLKGLVHQLYEITNIKVDLTEGGCTLTADFPKVEYDYYFREIGIIVTTDEGDKLYAYDNCGEDAQYMVSSTGVETTKKRIRLALTISDVAEITVSAAEILYVAYDDYEKTVEVLKQSLEEENERAKGAEKSLSEKLQEEKERAEAAEGILTENLQKEVIRAKEAEETNKNNLTAHVADKANPHKVTKVQVGLGNVDNTADVNKPVSAYQQNAIDSAYQQATGYTDRKIADLIGGAPETLDTLKEVADAIQANKDVSEALDEAIGKKANQTELDTHTGNNTIHITSQERTNWNDANTKKHTHSNKSVLDKITQALLDSWNTAYTHISDAVKHVTAAERTLWNTVSNKVDKVSGKGLSTNDYTTAEKSKLAGIAAKPSLRKIKVVQGDKIRITTNTYCFLSDFQSVYTLKTTELIIFNMVAAASYGSSDIVWKLSGLRGTSTTNWTGIAFSKIFDSLSWNFVSIFSISRMELMNGPNMCIEMTLGSAPIQACEIFYSDNVEIIKI